MGADWLRPERGIRSYKKAERNFEKKFKKHGREIGDMFRYEFRTLSYQIIKDPDEVYVEVYGKDTFYIFKKGDIIVISRDDNLKIYKRWKISKRDD